MPDEGDICSEVTTRSASPEAVNDLLTEAVWLEWVT